MDSIVEKSYTFCQTCEMKNECFSKTILPELFPALLKNPLRQL